MSGSGYAVRRAPAVRPAGVSREPGFSTAAGRYGGGGGRRPSPASVPDSCPCAACLWAPGLPPRLTLLVGMRLSGKARLLNGFHFGADTRTTFHRRVSDPQ